MASAGRAQKLITLSRLPSFKSAHGLDQRRADLLNHVANESTNTGDIDNDGSIENAKLATQDYALSQALNMLKGMALNRPAGATAPAAPART